MKDQSFWSFRETSINVWLDFVEACESNHTKRCPFINNSAKPAKLMFLGLKRFLSKPMKNFFINGSFLSAVKMRDELSFTSGKDVEHPWHRSTWNSSKSFVAGMTSSSESSKSSSSSSSPLTLPESTVSERSTYLQKNIKLLQEANLTAFNLNFYRSVFSTMIGN